MAHNTVDYSKCADKDAEALKDIKFWLGDRYDLAAQAVRNCPNPHVFALACSFAGIHGYPVKAWYEHFHGEGSWDKWFADNPKAPTL